MQKLKGGGYFKEGSYSKSRIETSLVIQWLMFCPPNAEGLGWIPGQKTRSHMLQLKILNAMKIKDLERHNYDLLQLTVFVCVCVLVAHSYLILCDSMDFSPPGSSVHGILRTRILEWVGISFSRGSSQSRE